MLASQEKEIIFHANIDSRKDALLPGQTVRLSTVFLQSDLGYY